MIKINQWVGAKGISVMFGKYTFSFFPSILSRIRLRKVFKPKYKDELFSIRKNQRTALNEWDLDITILGITYQFNKYKDFVLTMK